MDDQLTIISNDLHALKARVCYLQQKLDQFGFLDFLAQDGKNKSNQICCFFRRVNRLIQILDRYLFLL